MCTLNVALLNDRIPSDIFDILAIATYEDYKRNSHGIGYYSGDEVKKQFKYFPMGLPESESVGMCMMSHTRLATCAKGSKHSLQPFVFEDVDNTSRAICMHNGIFQFREKQDMSKYSDSYIYFDLLFDKIYELEQSLQEEDLPKVYPENNPELSEYPTKIMKVAIESMANDEILPSSYYSCFIWIEDSQRAFYWKSGAKMYMYEGRDMIYLSTTDWSDLLNAKMQVVEDKVLYSFYIGAKNVFKYNQYPLDIAEPRYPLSYADRSRSELGFGNFLNSRFYEEDEDYKSERTFPRAAF